ncbi:transposase [Streptomyces sp. ST1015]|nr:transposase [Streptomyces sp. ST1015]
MLHLSHSTISRSCPTTNSLSCSGHKTSKIHLVRDALGHPLAFSVTGGNTNNCTQFTTVMDAIRVPRSGPGRPRIRPDRVIGDKGYSS